MYAKTLIRWIALGSLVGVAAGAGSALFLWLLAEATAWRVDHETIVFALPAAGAVIGWLYARFGTSIQAGNNLVIDTIHDAGPRSRCACSRWCSPAPSSPTCSAAAPAARARRSRWARRWPTGSRTA